MILAAGLLVGCYSPDPISLNSNSAPSLIPAIKIAAEKDDRGALPQIVGRLDDHDSAVRFAAINALRRMTGEDFGYRYYDDESARKPAMLKWNRWLKAHPVSR